MAEELARLPALVVSLLVREVHMKPSAFHAVISVAVRGECSFSSRRVPGSDWNMNCFTSSKTHARRRRIGLQTYCTIIANAAQARYFVLGESDESSTEGGPDLFEQPGLTNPAAKLRDREIFSNLRGKNRSHPGGTQHRYDDHRAAHDDETTQRFARRILDAAESLVDQENADVVVLAASPKMLGKLRPLVSNCPKVEARLVEYGKDLCLHGAREIHDALAQEGLLPERQEPTYTRNGRVR